MKSRVENLERKLDKVVRLLRGRHHTRTRGQSPPWREHRRIEMEDCWDGGTRRTKERCPPPCSEDGSLRHRKGFSWGSRPPDSSPNSEHPRCYDDGQRRATVDRGSHQTGRARMLESSHNKGDRGRRERREPLGCGRPPQKPPDFETKMVMVRVNKEEPPKKVDEEGDSEVMEKESATSKVERPVGREGGATKSTRKAMMVVALDSMKDETETGIARRSPTIFQQKGKRLATAAKLGIPKMANEARPSLKQPDRENALMVAVELSTEMIATNIQISRSLVARPPPPKPPNSETIAATAAEVSLEMMVAEPVSHSIYSKEGEERWAAGRASHTSGQNFDSMGQAQFIMEKKEGSKQKVA